jgi:hypothetical protein
MLNPIRTVWNRHGGDVTLNEVKSLPERPALSLSNGSSLVLRMTTPDGRDVMCTNVMPSDVVHETAKGVCS